MSGVKVESAPVIWLSSLAASHGRCGPLVPGSNTAFAEGQIEWVVPKITTWDATTCPFWNGWLAAFW